jgi:hypothetical protein
VGVAIITELVDRLGVIEDSGCRAEADKGPGSWLSAGEFLIALAQAQLCTETALVRRDRPRDCTVAEELSVVVTPAPTTAASVARRFTAPTWV